MSILFCSSFCQSEKIAKLCAKSNELIFVSSNFGFALSSLLVSTNNDSNFFINKLKNTVLNM